MSESTYLISLHITINRIFDHWQLYYEKSGARTPGAIFCPRVFVFVILMEFVLMFSSALVFVFVDANRMPAD